MATLYQKTPTTECAKCHKALIPGDRVMLVLIVQQVGRNSSTQELAALVCGDQELAHVSCPDPGLEGKLILT